MRASKQRRVLSALLRPALWFCACNLLAAAVAAQCTNPTQVPNGTYTSGDHSQVDNNALSASSFGVSGGATATFAAGNCIHLGAGFRANAVGATVPTTFHAWVDIAPTAVSVVPSSPPPNPPLTQSFTWTVSSPAGHSNLSHIFALFNTTSTSTSNACYIHYDASSNLVYLADDASANWLGGFVPSSSGSVGNSQCTITGTGSSPNPTSSGTQLGLMLNVTFYPASFSGDKNEYLYALDGSGVSTGWQQMGTWTVPAPLAPDFTLTAVTDSYYVQTGSSSPSYTLIVTPQNGFNSPVSFSMSWPLYGCGYPTFNPSQVAGPPWTTTVSMQCYETLQNSYWTTVTASGGGKSHQLSLYLNVGPSQQYFLSTAVSPAAGGTIYPASGWYTNGMQVMVTASANAGYQFTGFSGSLTGGSPGYVIMNSNKSVTANFTPTSTYTLSTSVSPSGGGTLTFSPPCCTYTAGTQVTITATAAGGYQFSGWNGVDSSNGSTGYVTMSANRSVTATFTPTTPYYTLTTSVSPTGGGTISPSCPNGCSYTRGQQVMITATAASGYQFSGFSGALTGSSSPQYLTITGTTNVTASFAPHIPISVTVTPTYSTLSPGQVVSLYAKVGGSTNTGVRWSSPALGSLDVNGSSAKYTPPASVSTTQTVTIIATSLADGITRGLASITVNAPPLSVLITPGPIDVGAGQVQQLRAMVSGTTDQTVSWTLSPSNPAVAGTISTSGLYTAPASVSGTLNVTVTAISSHGGSAGQAQLTLEPSVTPLNFSDFVNCVTTRSDPVCPLDWNDQDANGLWDLTSASQVLVVTRNVTLQGTTRDGVVYSGLRRAAGLGAQLPVMIQIPPGANVTVTIQNFVIDGNRACNGIGLPGQTQAVCNGQLTSIPDTYATNKVNGEQIQDYAGRFVDVLIDSPVPYSQLVKPPNYSYSPCWRCVIIDGVTFRNSPGYGLGIYRSGVEVTHSTFQSGFLSGILAWQFTGDDTFAAEPNVLYTEILGNTFDSFGGSAMALNNGGDGTATPVGEANKGPNVTGNQLTGNGLEFPDRWQGDTWAPLPLGQVYLTATYAFLDNNTIDGTNTTTQQPVDGRLLRYDPSIGQGGPQQDLGIAGLEVYGLGHTISNNAEIRNHTREGISITGGDTITVAGNTVHDNSKLQVPNPPPGVVVKTVPAFGYSSLRCINFKNNTIRDHPVLGFLLYYPDAGTTTVAGIYYEPPLSNNTFCGNNGSPSDKCWPDSPTAQFERECADGVGAQCTIGVASCPNYP